MFGFVYLFIGFRLTILAIVYSMIETVPFEQVHFDEYACVSLQKFIKESEHI